MPPSLAEGGPPVLLKPGTYAILSTPFTDDDRVDLPSLERLTRFYVEAGADGVVALAVMGEGAKLLDAERDEVLKTVVETVGKKIPVIAGVSAPSVMQVRHHIDRARQMGVNAVMLAPTAGTDPLKWYHAVSEAGLPMVLQDHPQSSQVQLTVPVIQAIIQAVPAIVAIKNEAPPTMVRTRQLRQALPPSITILGGLGGVEIWGELTAGADGTMTGFAFPELLTAIVGQFLRGNPERARTLYEAGLPWLLLEAMPIYSLAIRKHILWRRGIIASARARQPSPVLDPFLAQYVDDFVERFKELRW
ncbi:Dihydrodipicolinate synthase [Sulfobacillus acidophilus DSM 10332]|uniref:Dihydrodipicolinate synthase n=1 Tax=Sulfobacillus acidophilus (strain ATCC 700253 / DSM 10332 / NAL) TaxID=679936 RepID=G8TX95_SULAD|nr:Dihydrodipicolinate synthase [Sulfobacillus acidophilus DSM 10332]